jgi:APA family basic amino acid/polyamine antiporter
VSGLSGRIGLPTATALVVGGTVGLGIFLTTAEMARGLASPALLFGVWAFLGASAFCGALCFGELASRHPQAGGGYVYLREAFGRRVAFLYGWKCLLVMDPGLTATLASGLGTHAHATWPWLPAKGAAVAAVLLVAAANLAGVRLAAGVGYGLAVVKVSLIALIVFWGFASDAGDAGRFLPFFDRRPGSASLVPAMAGALIAAFFSFGGWWETSKLAGEMRDPRRNLPRALLLGVGAVTVIYMAVSAVFIHLVPLEAAGSGEAFALEVGKALVGPAGGRALSGAIAFSLLGSLFAFMTMAPRVYYAMSRDHVLPGFVGRLHPRTGSPAAAVAIQAVLAAALVLIGSFESIMAYFIFVTVAFLGMTVAGLFRLRRRGGEPPYRTPLFPWTPAAFLSSIATVLVLLAAGRPQQAALGVAVVALGIPAYRLFAAQERA